MKGGAGCDVPDNGADMERENSVSSAKKAIGGKYTDLCVLAHETILPPKMSLQDLKFNNEYQDINYCNR